VLLEASVTAFALTEITTKPSEQPVKETVYVVPLPDTDGVEQVDAPVPESVKSFDAKPVTAELNTRLYVKLPEFVRLLFAATEEVIDTTLGAIGDEMALVTLLVISAFAAPAKYQTAELLPPAVMSPNGT
jgi:hypothetical protein